MSKSTDKKIKEVKTDVEGGVELGDVAAGAETPLKKPRKKRNTGEICVARFYEDDPSLELFRDGDGEPLIFESTGKARQFAMDLDFATPLAFYAVVRIVSKFQVSKETVVKTAVQEL
jgi:hypothetical protein